MSLFSPALAPLLLVLSAATSHDTIADAADHNAAAQWAKQHFEAKSSKNIPFSFSIDGKSFQSVFPAWKVTTEQKSVPGLGREIHQTFTDPGSGLVLHCDAKCFSNQPAVEWVLRLENKGTAESPLIESLQVLDAPFPKLSGGATVGYNKGDSNSAETFSSVAAVLGVPGQNQLVLSPSAGRSSEDYLPFFNVEGKDGGMSMAVGWSGQWRTAFTTSDDKTLSIQAGQQTTHFRLHPGESVRTPSILLVFWKGDDALAGYNLMRRTLFAHVLPKRDGQTVFAPACAGVNFTEPNGSYEGPHTRYMKTLAERGFEVFWSDMDPQQWYPGGFPNGTGTWDVDPAKYPHGLKVVGDAAHAAGLKYLLWFEPERVAPGTRIAKEKPQYVISKSGDGSGLFNIGDPEARKWLTDYIDQTIGGAGVDWVRWDFNIQPLEYWHKNDTPDRQGVSEMHYIEGLYTMWDDLSARHPGLLVDICASGGRRIDIETLSRGLPLWHSDAQCAGKPQPLLDQVQNAGLWLWVPMHGCGSFAYEPSYGFRSAMTSGNILVPCAADGRISTGEPDTEAAVKATIAISKKARPCMLGDFYPLFPPGSEETWFGYQFHRSDQNTGMVVAFRREKAAQATQTLALHDIDERASYELTNQDSGETKRISGSELARLSVSIPNPAGSQILFYRRTAAK